MRLTARGRRLRDTAALIATSSAFYGAMLLITALTGPDTP